MILDGSIPMSSTSGSPLSVESRSARIDDDVDSPAWWLVTNIGWTLEQQFAVGSLNAPLPPVDEMATQSPEASLA